MRPGLAGPQIRDPLGLGLREGAHGDTELAPSFTRPPSPNPARSSASEPASTGVCVCVRVPLRPPQGSAPRSQPTLNFSPGKPGKLKGAVAVRVGVCVGGGGAGNAGLSTSDSSVTYLSSFGNGWSPRSRSRNRYRGGKGSTSVSRSFIVETGGIQEQVPAADFPLTGMAVHTRQRPLAARVLAGRARTPASRFWASATPLGGRD